MRVVLADDSVLFREGLARVLMEGGFDVIGQAGDAEELLACVAEGLPDIAIVDIRMPPTHSQEGLVAAQQIRQRHPQVGVLVLSQYLESHYAMKLISEGAVAVGYLLKDRVLRLADLLDVVARVGRGECVIDQAVVAQLVSRPRRPDPIARLTPREREVLGANRRRPVEPGDQRPTLPHRQDCRITRPEHLLETRPGRGRRRQPSCPGGIDVPPHLTPEPETRPPDSRSADWPTSTSP